MAYTSPTVAQFQAQFARDFPYTNDINTGVVPADITSAINLTDYSINQGMWPDQTSFTLAFLYLTAHYLVMNLRAASQGINGQYNWLQNSKSVGQVSESFSIPQRILDNPTLSQLAKTNYGAQYLQMLIPNLVGQMYTVQGSTKP